MNRFYDRFDKVWDDSHEDKPSYAQTYYDYHGCYPDNADAADYIEPIRVITIS